MTYFNIRKFEPSGAGQLSVSWHWLLFFFFFFGLSYCSWGSCGENTEVVCHSLLQWTMFCQNLPLWPVCFGWPLNDMAHRFIELCKPLCHNKIHEGAQLNGHKSEQTPGDLKDREAWCAAVHGVTKRRTWLSDWTTTKWPRAPAWKSTWKSNNVDPTHGYLLQITIHVPGMKSAT